VTPPRPLLKKFSAVMSGLSLGTSTSNFKSIALTVFELLTFNSHWPAAAHTDRQTDKHTSNEHIISAIHFVHLVEINMHISVSTIISPCIIITKPESWRSFYRNAVRRIEGWVELIRRSPIPLLTGPDVQQLRSVAARGFMAPGVKDHIRRHPPP